LEEDFRRIINFKQTQFMISCKTHATVSWIFQLIAAAILLQTLWFKFTGAEESKYIFSTLGVEPWGRIGSGVAELAASALLLRGRTAIFGALMAMGIMAAAMLSHLTKLGIVVKDDGGLLFGLACTVFASAGIVAWLRRSEIPFCRACMMAKSPEKERV
jgi:uncharacterized membrane protein YphA (DoxX/SURF4 family)